MKTNIFGRTAAPSGRAQMRRFRVPATLSVALVSGVLATGCSPEAPAARDSGTMDVKPSMTADGGAIDVPPSMTADGAADSAAIDMRPMMVADASRPDVSADARDGGSDLRDGGPDVPDMAAPRDTLPDRPITI
jgi:hypothetical protein